MTYYIIRRLLLLIPTLIGITLVSFLILQLVPGDPARLIAGMAAEEEDVEKIRVKLGLDKPILVQYGVFLSNIARGDFGDSIATKNAVINEVWPRFLNTIRLAIFGIALAITVGIIIGVIAGIYHNGVIDHLSMVFVLLGISTPAFWLGLLLILLFSVHLGWLPSGGVTGWQSMILPGITIASAPTAMIARVARSSIVEVLRQDYIKTARAKGQKEWKIIYSHALKNALIPTITIAGLQFGYMIGSAVLVETIFTWPGLGRMVVFSITQRDYPMVQGGVLIFAFAFVLVNIIVDILYTWIDPRITYD